jgi:hypothetical protein
MRPIASERSIRCKPRLAPAAPGRDEQDLLETDPAECAALIRAFLLRESAERR